MGKASRRKRERRRPFEIELPRFVSVQIARGVKSERVFSVPEWELIEGAAAQDCVVALLKNHDFAAVDALLNELRFKAGA